MYVSFLGFVFNVSNGLEGQQTLVGLLVKSEGVRVGRGRVGLSFISKLFFSQKQKTTSKYINTR